MAQTFTKALLSNSTNGKGIKVAAVATPGTAIHTAVNSTTALDEIWIYAFNSHTADVVLTIEWGEATAPDGNDVITIPSQAGRYLVIDGRLLNNNLIVKAFASVTNVIIIDGFVNQIA
jgi:hypothetical protein